MHGLVCVDEHRNVLRNSIIWCDSRAVSYGNDAFDSIGHENCLSTMLNSPGNFTASKLAWVKNNEPEIYSRIYKMMLPGDYIAMKLSGGDITTTVSGLSEGVLWDFSKNELSRLLMDYYGFNGTIIPDIVPTFGTQTVVCENVALELGLKPGVPITYRAGDQPNNALSLNVLNPGEVAATGGTSGVVYGVLGCVNHDPMSRVNSFAHVNHHKENPRLGVLLCINGTGILNAWMRKMIAPDGYSYSEMNGMAASVPIGCDGLTILPFGNGSERILCNNNVGCSIDGLNFNNHTKAHLLRAAQEGIVYSFRYGIEIMENMGLNIRNIHAGYATCS
jgi:xylulokinase